tara:strand:+ start:399 stop:698 length:300 start_codon:yes stop_codon:yes gene_type:complete
MLITDAQREKVRSFSRNTRIIHFKYFGPTDHRGSRVKLTDKYFKQSIYVWYDYSFNSAYQIAIAHLIRNDWDVIGMNSEEGIIIIGTWDADQQLKDTRR